MGPRPTARRKPRPIYLTIEGDNPNAADVRFLIDGVNAAPLLNDPASAPKTRAVLMFDGNDVMELQAAREQWKELRDAGFELVYFQEDERGAWAEKKREKKA